MTSHGKLQLNIHTDHLVFKLKHSNILFRTQNVLVFYFNTEERTTKLKYNKDLIQENHCKKCLECKLGRDKFWKTKIADWQPVMFNIRHGKISEWSKTKMFALLFLYQSNFRGSGISPPGAQRLDLAKVSLSFLKDTKQKRKLQNTPCSVMLSAYMRHFLFFLLKSRHYFFCVRYCDSGVTAFSSCAVWILSQRLKLYV